MKLFNEIKDWSKYKSDINYIQAYHKKYVDENGIKYFITINHWQNKLPELMVAYVKFKRGFEVFNIEYIVQENTTLKQMEDFFEEIWSGMKCDYEKYEL